MHAFLVLAISNSSRTILAPYKTQSLTLSEDNKSTEKKQEKMSKKWNPKKIHRDYHKPLPHISVPVLIQLLW